jgi:CheY-like chemotaxis protein
VRAIAVTGHHGDDLAKAARDVGFAAHLVKPVTFDALLRALALIDE